MHIELTLGLPPDGVFELFTNPHNGPNTEPLLVLFLSLNDSNVVLIVAILESVLFLLIMKKSKSRKVLKDDGPRQIVKVKKAVAWNFRGRSIAIPISLIVDENRRDLTVRSFSITPNNNQDLLFCIGKI